ncbi:hypothetical protein [Cyanobium sp. NIES-981]|uniref:hypothetical protein n=1 Tax=Cyanobium sp. NIES-981 TaxID=1851505 RepID=UPI001560D80B|nr:hypothetical protein [Cyanobium sp. NIES-981]
MAVPAPVSASLVRPLLVVSVALGAAAALSACQPKTTTELQQLQQRLEQQDVKIQQLEQKLNAVSPKGAADSSGKPPAGPVKSLTYRTSPEGNRLRIYWGDGKTSDLECTKEQATLVCG